MQWLHGTYATAFNERYGLSGHLFQGRFGCKLVETTEHRLYLVRYFAWNPVEAELCAAPGEWPWSGYAALVGTRHPPRFLSPAETLALFGVTRSEARRRLAAFVRDTAGAPLEPVS